MVKVEEYILLPLVERQVHLKLKEPCIERGGDTGCSSVYCRALLAHILDTTIPSGMKIHVCHACHNSNCSHPNHIYWGTPYENKMDAIVSSKAKSIWEYTVAKYGIEKAKELQHRTPESCSKGGKKNKGRIRGTPSIETRQKISEALKIRSQQEVKS